MNDPSHFLCYKPFILAVIDDIKVTSKTMLMLLAGINIAAIIGESAARTANDKPTTL